ncbi:uncharacterized protein LOC133313446 [Gastrolobium bilobum]|uniref:uncharacterized protein LOC133313446 n=1 Tax=Gastrolobium bilobum TaxID=150636 RepID=UPI002AB231B1|nr:uncharacterized protein LOC133313446 [Gastrolobium bilobum]
MTGEEVSGPAGPKLIRLVWFVGAGVICTAAINKWREFERKAIIQQHQQQQEVGSNGVPQTPNNSSNSVSVHEPLK